MGATQKNLLSVTVRFVMTGAVPAPGGVFAICATSGMVLDCYECYGMTLADSWAKPLIVASPDADGCAKSFHIANCACQKGCNCLKKLKFKKIQTKGARKEKTDADSCMTPLTIANTAVSAPLQIQNEGQERRKQTQIAA